MALASTSVLDVCTSICVVNVNMNVNVDVQAGHQPQVRVWELARLAPLAELKGHDFAVRCVSFSPNAKFVVSVGNQFDHVRVLVLLAPVTALAQETCVFRFS